MAGEIIGWFEIKSNNDTHSNIEICGNEQFYLGRDPELCRYAWYDDLTISRKHLRIHCILYEQDAINGNIPPFVYVTDLSSNGTSLKKSNTECTGSQDDGVLMDSNDTFLLDDGDELVLSASVSLVFHSKTIIHEIELTALQTREKHSFAYRYLLTGRLLGEGGFGKVLVGISQETTKQLACKLVALDRMYSEPTLPKLRLPTSERMQPPSGTRKRWPTKVANCFREFDILKELSHPNVIAIEKVFWSHHTIYIFQDLVTGGDLFSFLEYKGGHLEDELAAKIIFQMLKGIDYLHAENVVHRDLKPDNVLMTSLDDDARVIITDFGAARFLPEARSSSVSAANDFQRMFSYVGTLDFAAPEIHRMNQFIAPEEGYSKSVDMWSVGTITATVLTGEMLFTNRNDSRYQVDPRAAIVKRAALCDLSILNDEYHPHWTRVCQGAKDFIRCVLVLDEKQRMTAPDALHHHWFSSYSMDFHAVYTEAIRDWQPRRNNDELIERIDRPVPEPISQFFTSSPVEQGARSPAGVLFRHSQAVKPLWTSEPHLDTDDVMPPVVDLDGHSLEEQGIDFDNHSTEHQFQATSRYADYSPNCEQYSVIDNHIRGPESAMMQPCATEGFGAEKPRTHDDHASTDTSEHVRGCAVEAPGNDLDTVQVYNTPILEEACVVSAAESQPHSQNGNIETHPSGPVRVAHERSHNEDDIVYETPPDMLLPTLKCSRPSLTTFEKWSRQKSRGKKTYSKRHRGVRENRKQHLAL